MKTVLFLSAIAIFFLSLNGQIDFSAVCAAINENEDVMYEVRTIKQRIILGEVVALKERIKKLEPYLGNYVDWSDGSCHQPDFLVSNINSLQPRATDDYWYTEKMVTRAESFFRNAPLPVSGSSSVPGTNQYDPKLQSGNRSRFKDHCIKEALVDPCLLKRDIIYTLFVTLDNCRTLEAVDATMKQHQQKLRLVVAQ